jgi:hypothetical protein
MKKLIILAAVAAAVAAAVVVWLFDIGGIKDCVYDFVDDKLG